jgi:hypothetical protein
MVSATFHVSGNVNETFNPKPILAATNDSVLCKNANVQLYLSNNSAFTGATYRWFKNGNPISGATDSAYLTTDTGDFRVEVKIDDCSRVSDELHIKGSASEFRP